MLVRIHAAGICYHDVLSRGGRIPGGHPGRILGHEIAGEIVAGGANVGSERIGERVVVYQRLFCGACRYCLRGRQDLCRNSRVLGESGGGGYAEFTCVPARNAIRHARRSRHECGGARGLSGRDQRARGAWRRHVEPGQRGPDHRRGRRARPASNPVVKSVKRSDRVTSSEEKAEIVRQAGADEVIVSPDLKFSGEVWRRTGKQGVDVVLDNVVTDTFGECLRSTAQNAIVVVLGNIGTKLVELDPGLSLPGVSALPARATRPSKTFRLRCILSPPRW